MPAYLAYDGSFSGLLTALDAALQEPARYVGFAAGGSEGWLPLLPVERVATDPARAEALLDRLRAAAGEAVIRKVFYLYSAEDPAAENQLPAYLRLVLHHGAQVSGWHARDEVRQVEQAARRVGGEIHRLKGLLRFRELGDGLLWAPLEPDADVIWSLAAHFRKRLRAERWLIHDVRRQYGVRHLDGRLDTVDAAALRGLLEPGMSAAEQAYSGMWRAYFRQVAIGPRRNPRLQRQNMPARYWRWLVEME